MSDKPQRQRDFVAPIKEQHRDLNDTREILRGWLAEKIPGASDLRLSDIQTPSGTGVANETLLFDANWSDGLETPENSRTQGFVARVATATPLYIDADIEIHCKMYQALADAPAPSNGSNVPVPPIVGYEGDESYLGAPFFVMEKIEGLIPADTPHYTESGFVADATPKQRRQLWEEGVRAMTNLHKVETSRVAFLDRPHLGKSGLEQEMGYWRKYLSWCTEGRPHETLEQGWEWLVANLPANPATSLSWGDSRIENIIYQDFRCMAVLDWDMVSLAGPETDLAWWIIMDNPAWDMLPGIGTPDELVEMWEGLMGRKAGDLHFYLAFTCFRLGAILIKLFEQMADSGLMTREESFEKSFNSPNVQLLSVLADLTPAGPITATLPRYSRLKL